MNSAMCRSATRILPALAACFLAAGVAAPATAAVRPDAGGPGTASLDAGQELQSGQKLVFGTLALVMGADGNIVITDQGNAVWANGKIGNPGAVLKMQSDGNLVEYTTGGTAVWSSGTAGDAPDHAELTGASGFEVVSSGTRLWGTPLPETTFDSTASSAPDVLFGGQSLGAPGFEMLDYNSIYSLYEYEGWLEEYLNNTNTLVWSAGSYCAGTSATDMQTDGNLVTYCNGVAGFNTGTYGNPGAYLHLLKTGEVIVASNWGTVLWSNGV